MRNLRSTICQSLVPCGFATALAFALVRGIGISFAIGLATPVAQDRNGTWEGEIEDPQRPVVVTADFNANVASLSGQASVPVTWRAVFGESPTVAFDVALGSQTLRFSGTRSDERIKGVVNNGRRDIPFWLERLPDLAAPIDRAEAWHQDLEVVATRFLRYDRSFTDGQRSAARARLEKLAASVNRRSDAEIRVELGRIVAMSGNAHTRLYVVRNRTEVRRLPIRAWWFKDQLRIVRSVPEHHDLLGCRVINIGPLNAAEALRRVRDVKPGNVSWQRYMSAYFLTSPDVLFGTGVITDPERVPLTVECDRTVRKVSVAPLPLRRSSVPVEAWWDLFPTHPNEQFGITSTALTPERAPRYLRNAQNYWFEYVPELQAIYLQLNRSLPMASDPLQGFTERLLRTIDERPVRALIVDVRFNTGGDAGAGSPPVEQLAGRLRDVPTFVLTSRATFSAGIIHAGLWKQFTDAMVIGERVGDHLDFWAEGGNILLPNSKLTVHYANGFHAHSRRDYPQFRPYFADSNVTSLEPAVVVEPSWVEYVTGRDPLFDIVAERIRRTRQ